MFVLTLMCFQLGTKEGYLVKQGAIVKVRAGVLLSVSELQLSHKPKAICCLTAEECTDVNCSSEHFYRTGSRGGSLSTDTT